MIADHITHVEYDKQSEVQMGSWSLPIAFKLFFEKKFHGQTI